MIGVMKQLLPFAFRNEASARLTRETCFAHLPFGGISPSILDDRRRSAETQEYDGDLDINRPAARYTCESMS